MRLQSLRTARCSAGESSGIVVAQQFLADIGPQKCGLAPLLLADFG
jgi:hypothetical protein